MNHVNSRNVRGMLKTSPRASRTLWRCDYYISGENMSKISFKSKVIRSGFIGLDEALIDVGKYRFNATIEKASEIYREKAANNDYGEDEWNRIKKNAENFLIREFSKITTVKRAKILSIYAIEALGIIDV